MEVVLVWTIHVTRVTKPSEPRIMRVKASTIYSSLILMHGIGIRTQWYSVVSMRYLRCTTVD